MTRFTILSTLMLVAVAFSTGCQSHDTKSMAAVPPPAPNGPPIAANNANLYDPQLGPGTTSSVPPITVVDSTPIPVLPPAQQDAEIVTLGSPLTTSATSSSYTVRRGDTLWRIASNKYGNGQKWKDIINANPGLTPQSLRIGQTINLP